MQYLILTGVVGMFALYAIIIVECFHHPEW